VDYHSKRLVTVLSPVEVERAGRSLTLVEL
jgi:hypothetical protein